jgi:hypothetical protein
MALAVSTLAVLSAGPANAFIGTPGTGVAPQTDAPDLISAEVKPDSAVGDQERIKFCFDEALNAPGTAGSFYAATYDAGRVLKGTAITYEPGTDAKCVVVSFHANVDLLRDGSVGYVNAGAVANTSSRPNTFGSAPLANSSLHQVAGQTTGPDLIGAVTDGANNSVTYTFDQPIQNTAALVFGDQFGVVDDFGAEVFGQDGATGGKEPVVLANRTQVRVFFTKAQADVTNKTRFFVTTRNRVATAGAGATAVSAVRGMPFDAHTTATAPSTPCGLGNATACLATPAPDAVISTGTSNRPVLASVTPVGQQFELQYTRPTPSVDASKVIAVLDDGNTVAGVGSSVVGSDFTRWNVNFGSAVNRKITAVVRIVSRTGAAKDPNTQEAAPISVANVGNGAPMRPGYTNGPDLLTATLDPVTSQATFTYDEPIDTNAVGSADHFYLLVRNGNPIPGASIGEAQDNHVKVRYGQIFDGASGIAIGAYAVSDMLGNPALYSSVSTTIVPAGGGPVTVPDAVTVQRGSSATVEPLRNDTITGTARVTMAATPAGITALVGANNVVTIAVAADYAGPGSVPLTYTVVDDNGQADGTITVTIAGSSSDPTTLCGKATIAVGMAEAALKKAETKFKNIKKKIKKLKHKKAKSKKAKKSKKKTLKKLKKQKKKAKKAKASASATARNARADQARKCA